MLRFDRHFDAVLTCVVLRQLAKAEIIKQINRRFAVSM
jgi:hypothetical protein